MRPCVHSSTIHNSQDVQTTEMPNNTRIGEEDVVHIHTAILLSVKESEIMPLTATWMQLEMIILSEASQKKTNIAYMWNLKDDINEPIYETESGTQRIDWWLSRGVGVRECWSLELADADWYI